MTTRDVKVSEHARLEADWVSLLLLRIERFEAQADRHHADLHAVLYGKVCDELETARDALLAAADLLDPDVTLVDDGATMGQP